MVSYRSFLRRMIQGIPLLTIISGLAVLIISIGDIMLNVDKNGCVMTWMYNTPRYIKIPLSQHVTKQFPKYNLFIYGEGRFARNLYNMQNNLQLTGIPVVFVHGNSGRFKQVRSPGSVSLTKSEKKAYNFNYFSVDFEEELSALYGPFLKKQTLFLLHSINRILECYENAENKPHSVIAIGHSVGGLVIRRLLSLPEFETKKINTFIALATPLKQPPVRLDQYIDEYYENTDRVWENKAQRKFENITFLSLGGGFRDYLVRSDLCLLNKRNSYQYHFSGLTTSLPKIWLSNDHQCIVWCNQLVRSLTRTFFNMIDPSTKQITEDHQKRSSILLQTMYFKDFDKRIFRRQNLLNCKHFDFDTLKSIDKQGCYRFITTGDEIIGILARTDRLYTLYQCNGEEYCSSLNYNNYLPGSIGSQFVELDNNGDSNYVLDVNSKEVFYLTKRGNKKTNMFTLPLMVPEEKMFHFEETFHVVISLTGFYSQFQSYNIEILAAGNIKSEIVIQIKHYGEPNSESNVYWFKPGENIRFQLKMFTVPTSNVIDVHLFSVKKISNCFVVATPNIEGFLGQVVRFKIEDCVRYLLVVYVACYVLSDRMKTFLQVFLLLRLRLSFTLMSRPTELLYKVVIPEMCMLLVTYVGCKLLSWIAELLFFFIHIPFFFFHKFIARRNANHQENIRLKIAIKFVLVTIVLYVCITCGVAFALLAVLCMHVFKINMLDDRHLMRKEWEWFVCFLPISITFSIVPMVVSVKDWTQGFEVTPSRFVNIEILTVFYLIYFLSEFTLPPYQEIKKNMKMAIAMSAIISVFMFNEFIKFYDITYLVVLGLLFNLCYPVFSTKLKME